MMFRLTSASCGMNGGKSKSLLQNVLRRVSGCTICRCSIAGVDYRKDNANGSHSLLYGRIAWGGVGKTRMISTSAAKLKMAVQSHPADKKKILAATSAVAVDDDDEKKVAKFKMAWSKGESEHLLSLVDLAAENRWSWEEIADKLSKECGTARRSMGSCIQRYSRLVPDQAQRKLIGLDRPWSEKELDRLYQTVEAAPRPLNWTRVVALFPDRSIYACIGQYQSMKDVADKRGKSTAWSAYERAVLRYIGATTELSVPGMMRKFMEHGGQDLLPGRSYNAIIKIYDDKSSRLLNTDYQLSDAEKEKIDTLLAKIKDMVCHRSKLFSEVQDKIIKLQVISTGSYNKTTQRYDIKHVDWNHITRLLSESEDSFTAEQCRRRWISALDPSIIKGGFSAKEEAMLLQLHEELGNKWSKIAERMGGKRTGGQCRSRWLVINPAVKKGPWTAEEKQQLSLIITSLLQYQNGSIATLTELKQRLTAAVAGGGEGGDRLKVAIERDARLDERISEGRFYAIAGELLERSSVECQAIWVQELVPSKKRGSMSKEEIALVLQGIHTCGEDYPRIAAEYLPDRTSGDIGARWTAMKSK